MPGHNGLRKEHECGSDGDTVSSGFEYNSSHASDWSGRFTSRRGRPSDDPSWWSMATPRFGTAASSEHRERRRAALEDLLPLWIEVDHCLYRLARWDSFPFPNLRPMPQYVERGFEYTGRLREQARDSASEVGTALTNHSGNGHSD